MCRLTHETCLLHLPQTPHTTLSALTVTEGAESQTISSLFFLQLYFLGLLKQLQSDTYQNVKTFEATRNVDMCLLVSTPDGEIVAKMKDEIYIITIEIRKQNSLIQMRTSEKLKCPKFCCL